MEPSACLAEKPVGPFASFTAGPGLLRSVQQEAAGSQTDLPTQHTPHSTRAAHQALPAGSSLPDPWLDPPRWASAEKSQACPPATGHSEEPSRDTWTRGPLSMGSCRTGHPTVYFMETKQMLEDGRVGAG